MRLSQVRNRFAEQLPEYTSLWAAVLKEDHYEDPRCVTAVEVRSVLYRGTRGTEGDIRRAIELFRLDFVRVLDGVFSRSAIDGRNVASTEHTINRENFIVCIQEMGKDAFFESLAKQLKREADQTLTICQQLRSLSSVNMGENTLSGKAVWLVLDEIHWKKGAAIELLELMGEPLDADKIPLQDRLEVRTNEIPALVEEYRDKIYSGLKLHGCPKLNRNLTFLMNYDSKYKGWRPSEILCHLYPEFKEVIQPRVFGEGQRSRHNGGVKTWAPTVHSYAG